MIGDIHSYENGNTYVETEMGPMITWHCDICGKPAAAAIEYRGPVKCVACWRAFHQLDTPQPVT